jgi:hypothetical protein
MQLATWLGHIIKSGEITLFTDDAEALQLKVENKKINVNAVNKDFLKDVVRSVGDGESLRKKLAQLRNMALELKEEGLTVTLSYEGELVVTVGSGANSKFSHLVTGTKAIEINNLRKLIELGV